MISLSQLLWTREDGNKVKDIQLYEPLPSDSTHRGPINLLKAKGKVEEKSCMQEKLNFLTCVDSSTNTKTDRNKQNGATNGGRCHV